MKTRIRPIAASLVFLMLLTFFAPAAAVAVEPFAREKTLTEADRRDFSRNRNRGGDWDRNRRPAPVRRPPVRRDNDRRSSGNSIAGAIFGLAVGGLIAGAIASSRNNEPEVYYVEPQPPVIVTPQAPVIVQPAQPVLVCDEFGNCWYEYPR